jgi:hypothetical protein
MITSPALPHEPRQLTQREFSSLDVRSYKSPKLNRMVQLVGVPCFCQALCYEFNPLIALFTERPRHIVVGDDALEVSFWIRYTNGKEQYVLVVPAAETEAATEGRRKHRRAQQLLDAATKVGLEFTFVFEAEFVARAGEVATALRLLPHVQVARTLPQRGILRDAIRKAVAGWPKIRLSELQRALEDFDPSDVQAIAADLIHEGTLQIDRQAPVSRHMLISTGDAS